MSGEEIKALRKKLGDTQVAFAKRLGVDPNTVARWERGVHPPKGLYATALARVAKEAGGSPE